MNNSVFGKRMENLRTRINFKLVSSAKDCVRYVSKPSFVSQMIFRGNFFAINEIKPVLPLNKPIYVGFSILDLKKFLMYDFHYKYIKSKCDANLLFMDTGSLVYEIKTEDVYEYFHKDKIVFDFSDYPLHSKIFDPGNKKVIGKIKDEFKVKILSEFVGPKSKMFSLIDADSKEIKKAKGVNKNVVRKWKNRKFVDVFFDEKMMRHKMKIILHKIA